MLFFDRIRNYIVYFILFGIWSAWPNSKYKILLRIYPIIPEGVLLIPYIPSVKIYSTLISLTVTLSILVFSTTFLTHLIIVIETILTNQSQLRLLREFSDVDQLFEATLIVNISHCKQKRQLFAQQITQVLSAIIATIKGISILYYTLYLQEYFLLCIIYSKWIIHLKTIQVIFFICMVRARLILVNKDIMDVQSIANVQQRRHRTEKLIFSRLLNLKEIYSKLYTICILINKTFGWSLLAVMTQLFIQITCNGYWLFLHLDNANSLPYTFSLFVSFCFLAPTFIMFGALAFYSTACFDCVSFLFNWQFFFF